MTGAPGARPQRCGRLVVSADLLDPGVARPGLHPMTADHLGRAEIGVQAATQARGGTDERAVTVTSDEQPLLFELEEGFTDRGPTHPERRGQLDLGRKLDALGESPVANPVADLLADPRGELRLADQRHVVWALYRLTVSTGRRMSYNV